MSSAPAFIDLSEQAQAEELLDYYESRGQKLSVSVKNDGMDKVVHALAEHCGICLKASDEDALATMTSIFSLFHMTPPSELGTVVLNICKQISADVSEKNARFRFSLLKTLFCIVEETASPFRADVWLHMLVVARKGSLLKMLSTEPADVQKNLKDWNCNTEKAQQVLRTLYETLQETGRSSAATDVLIMLVSMYTNPNTPQAQTDAKKCIFDSIKESNTYLFDRLLRLPAVQQMKDQPIYKLLNTFVSGTFSEYTSFYKSNKAVVDEAGLDNDMCEHKMRILTFISLAASAPSGEVPFDTMKQELRLESDEETEMLVIDAIRTTLVKAKIDQQKRVVTVSSCLQRTFGQAEWQLLYDLCDKWRQGFVTVRESLHSNLQ